MEDDSTGNDGQQQPESLLPYDDWTEAALRQVMVRALQHVAAHGLPGNHHFYITFRTDHPGTSLPARLKGQYPEEMTIVLQHQFWDLAVDETEGFMTIGLSFGGVPSTLRIPLDAISAFADPQVRYMLRFRVAAPEAAPDTDPAAEPASPDGSPAEAAPTPQVVSLDAFRRRTPPKDG